MVDRTIHKDWIKKFKNNPKNENINFKRLKDTLPPVDGDGTFIEYVDFEEFIKIEDHRIPLFVGTIIGIMPNIDKMPEFFNGKKRIAILAKSVLSGCIFGLTISQIEAHEKILKVKTLEYYKNEYVSRK